MNLLPVIANDMVVWQEGVSSLLHIGSVVDVIHTDGEPMYSVHKFDYKQTARSKLINRKFLPVWINVNDASNSVVAHADPSDEWRERFIHVMSCQAV